MLVLTQRADTENLPGKFRMTSSVLCPIEPLDPMIAIFFIAAEKAGLMNK
jgi:hypothetical protein